MSRHFRDECTPWSFVFPIALAVMPGVLSADLVRLTVAGIMARAAMDQLNESLRKQTTPGHLPARPNMTEALPQEEPIQYGPDAFFPELPGLLNATKNKLDRACIGGTVSVREKNGWSQDMSSGMPKRCVATSD
jgi:hypothetical protein